MTHRLPQMTPEMPWQNLSSNRSYTHQVQVHTSFYTNMTPDDPGNTLITRRTPIYTVRKICTRRNCAYSSLNRDSYSTFHVWACILLWPPSPSFKCVWTCILIWPHMTPTWPKDYLEKICFQIVTVPTTKFKSAPAFILIWPLDDLRLSQKYLDKICL